MRGFLGVALGALALQSCAAVTTGTTQSMTVMTEPAGAQCKLTRGENTVKVVAVVNPTPSTLRIDKSGDMMTIECTKEGFEAAKHYVEADFQAMTMGNAILGGIIGVAVDAASGAMAKYPETAHIILTPATFATVEERDARYTALKDAANKRWDAWSHKASAKCQEDKLRTIQGAAADRAVDCAQEAADREAKRQEELADLETRRLRATIGAQAASS
jgi:hypothetical protein